MKMTRIVYHIAGKDYEEHQTVTLTFFIQTVSIQNFLSLVKLNHCYVDSYDNKIINDSQITHTNGLLRKFKIKGFSPNITKLAIALGKYNHNTLDDNWYVRNASLRSTTGLKPRYNGYTMFDPITKKTTFKSNAPAKLKGKQTIINGKLWRKYI